MGVCPFAWIKTTRAPGCLGTLVGRPPQLVWEPQPCLGIECQLWNSEASNCALIGTSTGDPAIHLRALPVHRPRPIPPVDTPLPAEDSVAATVAPTAAEAPQTASKNFAALAIGAICLAVIVAGLVLRTPSAPQRSNPPVNVANRADNERIDAKPAAAPNMGPAAARPATGLVAGGRPDSLARTAAALPAALGRPFLDSFPASISQMRRAIDDIVATASPLNESTVQGALGRFEQGLAKAAVQRSAQARKLNDEGIRALQQHDTGKAVEAFAAAYRINPTDVEITENLGYANLEAGKLDDAELHTALTLLMAPRRATAWNNLGQISALRGDPGGATACFVAAFSVSRARDATKRFYEKARAENPHAEVRDAAAIALALVSQSASSGAETTNGLPLDLAR